MSAEKTADGQKNDRTQVHIKHHAQSQRLDKTGHHNQATKSGIKIRHQNQASAPTYQDIKQHSNHNTPLPPEA
jgi:hypothetical protein